MLIAVIPIKDYKLAHQHTLAIQSNAQGIELRLDYLDKLDFKKIDTLRKQITIPVIFTLRKKSQGGLYQQDEEQRLKDILQLCQLNPDFLDLEYDVPNTFLYEIKLQYPNIKLICSYHNFEYTPDSLQTILYSIKNSYSDSYKIATYANKTLDALKMLEFIKIFKNQFSLTGICMGEAGQCTRILGPIVGNAFNYASASQFESTASGQFTIDELLSIYSYDQLTPQSNIYALLGNPIHLSLGHILHNLAMRLLKKNAVYIKLQVSQDELSDVLKKCRQLCFSGFSITMPLKENILPLLDTVETESGAVNTIALYNNKYMGYNTDGEGVIAVLAEKMDLSKQRIIILGAGGAARAIAYALVRHKAKVIILNRTLDKALQLANELGCEGYDLNQIKNLTYTFILNTLPDNIYADSNWLQSSDLLPKTYAMDIVYQPVITGFLRIAKSANCICIPGYEMFIHQALLQIKKWFNVNNAELEKIKSQMYRYFCEIQ